MNSPANKTTSGQQSVLANPPAWSDLGGDRPVDLDAPGRFWPCDSPDQVDHPGPKRIFLVDDDNEVRGVLQALLEHAEPQWVISEFDGAEGALAACGQNPPHLIISDQTMPKISGTEMFDVICRKFPETIRILMSGHASNANKIASAQQYLAKPFNIRELSNIVNGALTAQESLASPHFARLVGSLTSFPALPGTCSDLLLELESDANTENMNRLITNDGGVLTRALHLANSPLFHGGTTACDAESVLRQLGTRNMRSLVLSVHVFQGYERINLPEINQAKLWQHCCQTAAKAQLLAKRYLTRKECDDVFFAGLVHDLGRLILMENRRVEYALACKQALAEKVSLESVEARLFGKTSTELTSFMLQLWGMPDAACRAVRNHLAPWAHPEEKTITASTILYIANYLSRQENPPDPFITPPLNEEYLKAVGFADWESLVSQ